MDERTLRILEWDKITGKVSDYCQTNMGKEYVAELKPMFDVDYIQIKLRETSEARRIARGAGHAPFGGIRDVRGAVKRCRLGGTADSSELFDLANTLQGQARLRKYLLDHDDYEFLPGYARDMGQFKGLEAELFRCLTDDGEVADNATPELNKIRSQLKTFQNRIRDKVESILRASENQKYFQEAIVTIRNDRYVLPVKQEYRQHIPGIVHDQSASGATLFIEPMAVVEMNNSLRQLQVQEKEEVQKVLAMLSAKVAADADMLLSTLEIMAYLDFTFAKAAYAESIRAAEPELNADGIIELRRARHPLLTGDVVPIDVNLGIKFNTLVITGPNTGGKTVTLKTTGLLTIMAQSGLHVPADIGSRIAVFDGIYSDIGDEQSIEQSLSTFSSHMVHIVEILANVTRNCLVLFDELGAGTDPTEGAALAMAILEHLHERSIRTIATTHYSELKTFAYSRDGVENASVEFDVNTLRPTYRLLIGVPGSSNAFAIATRLGLSERIVGKAKSFLTQEDIKIETLIKGIEEDRRSAEQSMLEARSSLQKQDQLKRQLEQENEKLKRDRAEIIRKAHEEAKQLVAEAKKECEELISLAKSADKTSQLEAARMVRDELKNALSIHNQKSQRPQPHSGRSAKPVSKVMPGQEVMVISLNQRATVISGPNAAGEVFIQAGIMKLNVKMNDLAVVDEQQKPSSVTLTGRAKRTNVAEVGKGKTATASVELDLRGLTVDEAIERTDKYLDDAALAGLPMARIIHGKGTGALRQAIRDMLKGHRSVRNYRYGESGEGGDGVTVIEFEK